MSRQIITALVAVAVVASTAAVEAGGCKKRVIHPPQPIVHPPVVHPPVVHPPVVRPIHNTYYFGMSVELRQTQHGQGLRVASITHYSPAWHAGLEVGDVIMYSNNQHFAYARDNQEGARMLQDSVSQGGAPVPTAAATATRLVSQPQATAQASLYVLDSRTGQLTMVQAYPQVRGGGGAPVPTATALAQ